jgi:RNA polymerase sigma factor (sigma-70 family)
MTRTDPEVNSYVERSTLSGLENVPALSAFQKRMSRYPQLSPEHQAELVLKYQEGLAAKRSLDNPKLSARATRIASQRVREGERAAEHLIGSNFRLVWLIVRENAEERFGRDRAGELLPDLVAEANLAVVEAATQFDPTRGPGFSTYLARVVRDRVRMVLTNHSQVRVSPSWARIKRIAAVRIPTLTTELGRPPTLEEKQADLLERCLEWAEDKLSEEQKLLPADQRRDAMMAKLRKQGMLGAIRDIDEVLTTTQSVASLDAAVGADRTMTLGEVLPGASNDAAFDAVEQDELSRKIDAALGDLSERERMIIRYRFGFVDGENWKYAKIAALFDVSAERIRQIEHAVLLRLADPNGAGRVISSFLPSADD